MSTGLNDWFWWAPVSLVGAGLITAIAGHWIIAVAIWVLAVFVGWITSDDPGDVRGVNGSMSDCSSRNL